MCDFRVGNRVAWSRLLLKRIEETPEPVRVTRLTIERLKEPSVRPLARCVLVLDAIHRVKEEVQ